MELHTLSNVAGARRGRVRVGHGRGSGKGKTCGRGNKGQMSRKGSGQRPGFEGGQMPLVRRLPKGGFTNPTRKVWLPVNVGDLSGFEDGAEVTAAALRERGMAKGKAAGIKILGSGELTRKLTVKAAAFSAAARQKIEAAGGICEVVPD